MSRRLDRWIFSYLSTRAKRRAIPADRTVHLLLCIADHYEPGNGGVSSDAARKRVRNWTLQYPQVLGQFHDSDGRPPRHSFFYPMEQYVKFDLELLAELCRQGFGEVEIHLHHDRDNSAALRKKLLEYKKILSERHGLLSSDASGQIMYGFIHGDWALDNSLPDGSCCGVNDELDVLRQTGCYADMTLPSAPGPAQTRKINSIYWAVDDPQRPMSHDDGIDVSGDPAPDNALLLIQGPLMLNWKSRKWGLLPRIENACVQASQPMTMDRLDLWLAAHVQVPSRPDWFFVKLHTHGAPESNQPALIGPAAMEFHKGLAHRANVNPRFQYHYVSAREMYNLVMAAHEGFKGPVAKALDHKLTWNLAARR